MTWFRCRTQQHDALESRLTRQQYAKSFTLSNNEQPALINVRRGEEAHGQTMQRRTMRQDVDPTDIRQGARRRIANHATASNETVANLVVLAAVFYVLYLLAG
jgi:hypothetical protein